MASCCSQVVVLFLMLLNAHVEAARSGAGARVAAHAAAGSRANPIRRVVMMLQAMQKKVTEEGQRDQELFDKFMCFCKTGAGNLQTSISEAEAKSPRVASALSEATAKKEGLEKELAKHRTDLEEAKEAVAEAEALWEKGAGGFAEESSEMRSNIAALGKAVAALEKGYTGFLQTSMGATLRRLTIDMDLSGSDRDLLSSFLSQGEGSPGTGEIIGILKHMKESMEKNLEEATREQESGRANYEATMAAKQREIQVGTRAIEEKLQRSGQLGVEIQALKEDLSDTGKQEVQDKKFLADLDKNCAVKKTEWEAVRKTRADELVALGDTIKILNSDDALDLFKKALPSTSLLQVATSSGEAKHQALMALKVASRGSTSGPKDPRMDLIALALRGRKISFEKIVSMIDDMITLLEREQKDDDNKKAYCTEELDRSEDAAKQLATELSDLEKVSEDAKGSIATLTEEIKSLQQGIKDLDEQVTKATKARKEENKEYASVLAANLAAKELLEVAIKRLSKFYAPPKPAEDTRSGAELLELSAEGQSEDGQQQVPDLVQLSALRRAARRTGAAPPPPPDAVAAYMKKSQESASVTAMLRTLMTDLAKEITEMEVEEKDAQAEYEQLVADSAAKRAADAKMLGEKEGTKAGLEAELQKTALEQKSQAAQGLAATEIIRNLHRECDWLMANFNVRQEARAGEADSLKNAKAVLSGADYSLVEMAHRHALRAGAR